MKFSLTTSDNSYAMNHKIINLKNDQNTSLLNQARAQRKPACPTLSPPLRRYGQSLFPDFIRFKNDAVLFGLLNKHYGDPSRGYHNLDHLADMLTQFERISLRFKNPAEVFLAILFHDIIYDVNSETNESDSAALAESFLNENLIDPASIDIDLVKKLIQRSKNHIHHNSSELTEDEKLFLDMDLSIMAAPWSRVMQWETGIQQEYLGKYNLQEYKNGRVDFLTKFLDRRIFFSDTFHERYQSQAQKNIKRLLAYVASLSDESCFNCPR